MDHPKKTARAVRADLVLSTLHQQQHSLPQRLHFLDLFGRVKNVAGFLISLTLLTNSSMAAQHRANTPAQEPAGLLQQQVGVGITNRQAVTLIPSGSEQIGSDSVYNRIPLSPPSQPEVAAKSDPEAHKAANKSDDSAIGVDPGDEQSLFHWLCFWAICFMVGAAIGLLFAPR